MPQHNPLAGHPPPASMLLDVSKLVTAYYTGIPDPSVPAQRVAFGTSGHRGSAFDTTFNEWHVVSISEAICRYRQAHGIDGPLFLGIDTHALSIPACATALEVLAARGVDVMLAEHDEYTPTPVVSHAILCYNRGRTAGLADDPLGGAGVHCWGPIAEHYNLDLTVVSDVVDQTFRFITVDWDGKIRMDPSSPYAMQRLIGLKDSYDLAFACDTDHDRHGVVTRSTGLLPPNHYLTVAINHLFQHRPSWLPETGVGKTVVSSATIDRVSAKLGRRLNEVPVGFKWFVTGLDDGSLGFCGEESAGASFLRRNGTAWTTDKDGIVLSLLAAEITVRAGRDPGEIYADLTREFGEPVYDRVEAPTTAEQKKLLAALSPHQVDCVELAGEKVQSLINKAPGNHAPIGGVKVTAATGWFAARQSGTENIYKIYAESFRGQEQLDRIVEEAQAIVDKALAGGAQQCGT